MGLPQYLGHGCLSVAERNSTGQILAVKKFHNTTFELKVEQEVEDHYNTCGTVAVRDNQIVKKTDVMGAFKADNMSNEALRLALAAELQASSALSISAVALPNPVAVGEIHKVPNALNNLTSCTVGAATGSPVAGTHYTVDLVKGEITIVSLAGLTQPLTVTATQKTGLTMAAAGKMGIQKRFLQFNGVNIADDNKPLNVIVPYARVAPSASSNFKNESVNEFDFEFTALEDPFPLTGVAGGLAMVNGENILAT